MVISTSAKIRRTLVVFPLPGEAPQHGVERASAIYGRLDGEGTRMGTGTARSPTVAAFNANATEIMGIQGQIIKNRCADSLQSRLTSFTMYTRSLR